MKQTILIVEDDMDISSLLKTILETAGYRVRQAYSGTEADLFLEREMPDLILLDLMLPGMTGEELLCRLRQERKCQLPVLVISARSGLADKVSLLKTGADDYITKPFEPEEVTARIQAALRRWGIRQEPAPEPRAFTYKNISLYPELRKVVLCGRELSLTRREYDLLHLLIQKPDKVYSREALYELVWQEGYYGEDHTVNVHISNLRKKLKEADPEGEYIQSVYGIGFRLAKS